MSTNKQIPNGCSVCINCNGSGIWHAKPAIVNGVLKSGFSNTCYRCQGKGYQSYADIRRNDYYDNHHLKVH